MDVWMKDITIDIDVTNVLIDAVVLFSCCVDWLMSLLNDKQCHRLIGSVCWENLFREKISAEVKNSGIGERFQKARASINALYTKSYILYRARDWLSSSNNMDGPNIIALFTPPFKFTNPVEKVKKLLCEYSFDAHSDLSWQSRLICRILLLYWSSVTNHSRLFSTDTRRLFLDASEVLLIRYGFWLKSTQYRNSLLLNSIIIPNRPWLNRSVIIFRSSLSRSILLELRQYELRFVSTGGSKPIRSASKRRVTYAISGRVYW